MTNEPLNTGSAIATYIEDVMNQIKTGLGENASLAGCIDLEMSTTLEKSAEGGFKISVLQAGAKVKHQEVHKIKVPIRLDSDVSKMEDEALKAEAKFKKTMSDKKTERLESGSHPSHLMG